MRTSFDLPDNLFRHLKVRAALEGISLRDLVVALLEQGIKPTDIVPVPLQRKGPPSVSLGSPMALDASQLSNARLNEMFDE